MHNELPPAEKLSLLQRISHWVSAPWKRMGAGKRRRVKAYIVAFIIMLVLLLAPSPFAIEMPGPTANVLGAVSAESSEKMIDISGVQTYADKGELRLVTVSATGVPGYAIPTAAAIWAWFDPHMAIMPQEAVYSVDTTADEYEQEGADEMTSAQDSAVTVAQRYASDNLGIDTSHMSVKLRVDDIGGPSAGMMYTLGIITSLTPQDEAEGKIIAGTGTIESDGSVGKIGGIQLKLLGAKRDGADYFIAPQSNCDEVTGHIPQGMQVFSVTNIEEAYKTVQAIGSGDTQGLASCPSN